MAQNKPAMSEDKRHHFLFHIFRMDKEENPMPSNRADLVLQLLKSIFADNTKNNKGRN